MTCLAPQPPSLLHLTGQAFLFSPPGFQFCADLLSTTSSSTISMASSKSPTSIWTGLAPTPVSFVMGEGRGQRSDWKLSPPGFPRTKKHDRTRRAGVTADLQAPPWTAGQRAGSRQTIIPSNNRAAGSTCGQNTRNLMVSSGPALLKLPAVGSLVPPDLCSRKP